MTVSSPTTTREMRQSPVVISVNDQTVSGIMTTPDRPIACYVMAHGAGAGMTHPFMAAAADGLARRRIATLRYQFPYMEHGSKRPDSPKLAHATVRAAVQAAIALAPHLPLVAGGKSFGGRMTSQAQANSPLPRVNGLAFLGFPLHPPKKPGVDRAQHLDSIRIPMLFLQGDRDALANLELLVPLGARLGATIELVRNADHSFTVAAISGRTNQEAMDEALDRFAEWVLSRT